MNKYTFLIPSYNRYDKLLNLVTQIKNDNNHDIIIFNDGSSDIRYDEIESQFSNLTVIKNQKNNGKLNHHNTIISILNAGIEKSSDYFILIGDDFILCDNFIGILENLIQENLIINIFSLNDTMWNIPGWIDGAFVSSKGGLSAIIKLIPKETRNKEGMSTGIWRSVTASIKKNSHYKIKNLNYSLIQHDGNDDSKLHSKFRIKHPIVANNFYNDFKGNEINIITSDVINLGLKKKQEDTKNGDLEILKLHKSNETRPIIKSVIDPRPIKLYKENKNPINKIPNDLIMGKIRKRNLRFGK